MSDKDLVSRRRVLARKKTMYGWSSGEEEVVSVEYIESIPPVKQPMSAVEFLIQWERMCQTVGGCQQCPVAPKGQCMGLIKRNPAEAVSIVEQWAREHPEVNDER